MKTWWICVLLTGSHPTPASPRSDEAAPSNVSSRPQNSGWICLRSKGLEAFFLGGGRVGIIIVYRHILGSILAQINWLMHWMFYDIYGAFFDIMRIAPPVLQAKDSSWGGSFQLPTFSPACFLRHGHTDPLKNKCMGMSAKIRDRNKHSTQRMIVSLIGNQTLWESSRSWATLMM